MEPEVEGASGTAAGASRALFLEGWFPFWGESTPSGAAGQTERSEALRTFPAAAAAALLSDEPRPAPALGAGEWAVLSLAAWSAPGLFRSPDGAGESRYRSGWKERIVG
jgi:hypothetical protein